MYQWDDLKFFLATVREGSATQAAQTLGVSTSTVTRRLAVLEEQLGAALLARTPEGLVVTEDGRRVAEVAERVERAASDVESAAGVGQQEPAGLVRVACTPDVAQLMIIPALPELMRRHPRLRVAVFSGTENADLGRREADIALRLFRPDSGELVSRKLRPVPFGIFGSVDLLARHQHSLEAGLRSETGASAPWVGLEPRQGELPETVWLRAAIPHLEPLAYGSSLTEVRLMAAAGLGLALLPKVLAQLMPRLREVTWTGDPALPIFSLWIVGHTTAQRTPRIQAVWNWLVDMCVADPEDSQVLALQQRHAQAYGE